MSCPPSPSPEPRTRRQLREAYGVSCSTFRKWLQQAGITHRRRTLSPAEVARVVGHLDPPE